MQFFPAIDILDGRVVRLRQGDFNDVTEYEDDPVRQACVFARQGARWIHVVDLSGAKSGKPEITGIVEAMVKTSQAHIEVGGGVRSMDSLDAYASIGVERVVIGTALVKDPDFAFLAAEKYPGMVVAGIDALDGRVSIEGWTQESCMSVGDLAQRFFEAGIRDMVYTDISRDGMQCGVDAAAYSALQESTNMRVVASGGVSFLDDLKALSDAGIWGAIAGKAIYEGNFTVEQALRTCEGES